MAAEKMYLMLKAFIGGSIRMVNTKDMEHGTIIKEANILGN
jgi:hypothetical protein